MLYYYLFYFYLQLSLLTEKHSFKNSFEIILVSTLCIVKHPEIILVCTVCIVKQLLSEPRRKGLIKIILKLDITPRYNL